MPCICIPFFDLFPVDTLSTGIPTIIIFKLYLSPLPQPAHLKVQGIIRAPLARGFIARRLCPVHRQLHSCRSIVVPAFHHRSQPAPYGLFWPVLPAPRLLSGSPRHEPRCSRLPECSRMTGMLLSMSKKRSFHLLNRQERQFHQK